MSGHQLNQSFQNPSFSSGYSGSFRVAVLAAMLLAHNIANAEPAAFPPSEHSASGDSRISGTYQPIKITQTSLDAAIVELLKSVHETLATTQVRLDPEASKLLRRNLWQLYK